MNTVYPTSMFQRILWKRFSPVFLLLLLAIELIILGIVLKENEGTLRNAHYLCLDCIGIG